MNDRPNEELEEVEQELGVDKYVGCHGTGCPSSAPHAVLAVRCVASCGCACVSSSPLPRATRKGDMESGGGLSLSNMSPAKWSILTKSFTLTFLAEWGDRSQVCPQREGVNERR